MARCAAIFLSLSLAVPSPAGASPELSRRTLRTEAGLEADGTVPALKRALTGNASATDASSRLAAGLEGEVFEASTQEFKVLLAAVLNKGSHPEAARALVESSGSIMRSQNRALLTSIWKTMGLSTAEELSLKVNGELQNIRESDLDAAIQLIDSLNLSEDERTKKGNAWEAAKYAILYEAQQYRETHSTDPSPKLWAGLEGVWVKQVKDLVDAYETMVASFPVATILQEADAAPPSLQPIRDILNATTSPDRFTVRIALNGARRQLFDLERMPTYPRENLLKYLSDAIEVADHSAAGLEGWAGGPGFMIYTEKDPGRRRDNRAVAYRFNAEGDQLWMRLFPAPADDLWGGKPRLAFLATDSDGKPISQTSVVIYRAAVLRDILVEAEAKGRVSQGTLPRIWDGATGRFKFENPETLRVLNSDPLRDELAKSKKITAGREKKRTERSTVGPELALGQSVKSIIAFRTGGDNPTGWYPFLEVVIKETSPSQAHLSFSSRSGVIIDRERVYEARRSPPAPMPSPAAGLEEPQPPSRPSDFGQGDFSAVEIGGEVSYEVRPGDKILAQNIVYTTLGGAMIPPERIRVGTEISVRRIQTIRIPLAELGRFALSGLVFRIVPMGHDELLRPDQASSVGVMVAPMSKGYLLQIWLNNDWVNLDNVHLEEGSPIVIGREDLPPTLDPLLQSNLEGTIGKPVLRRRFRDVFGGWRNKKAYSDSEWRIAISWMENELTKAIYLPRQALSTGISRGDARVEYRPGWNINNRQFVPAYRQTGHLQVEIMGDDVVFSDLGSTQSAAIEARDSWVAKQGDRIQNGRVERDLWSITDSVIQDASERVSPQAADSFGPSEASGRLADDAVIEEMVAGFQDRIQDAFLVIEHLGEEGVAINPEQAARFPFEKPFWIFFMINGRPRVLKEFVVREGQLYARRPRAEDWKLVGNDYQTEEPVPVAGQSKLDFEASAVMEGYRILYAKQTNNVVVLNHSPYRLQVATLAAGLEASTQEMIEFLQNPKVPWRGMDRAVYRKALIDRLVSSDPREKQMRTQIVRGLFAEIGLWREQHSSVSDPQQKNFPTVAMNNSGPIRNLVRSITQSPFLMNRLKQALSDMAKSPDDVGALQQIHETLSWIERNASNSPRWKDTPAVKDLKTVQDFVASLRIPSQVPSAAGLEEVRKLLQRAADTDHADVPAMEYRRRVEQALAAVAGSSRAVSLGDKVAAVRSALEGWRQTIKVASEKKLTQPVGRARGFEWISNSQARFKDMKGRILTVTESRAAARADQRDSLGRVKDAVVSLWKDWQRLDKSTRPTAGLETVELEKEFARFVARFVQKEYSERVVEGGPPEGYVRVVSDELIRQQLARVPPYLLTYLGLRYVRVVPDDPRQLDVGVVYVGGAVLNDPDLRTDRPLTIILVSDIPDQLKEIHELATAHAYKLAQTDEVKFQAIYRAGVLHEIGEAAYKKLPEFMKSRWENIYRREGYIYQRNQGRLVKADLRITSPALSKTWFLLHDPSDRPVELDTEIFADTFAWYFDPDSISKQMGQPPLKQEEITFIQEVLDWVKTESQGWTPLPGTYASAAGLEGAWEANLASGGSVSILHQGAFQIGVGEQTIEFWRESGIYKYHRRDSKNTREMPKEDGVYRLVIGRDQAQASYPISDPRISRLHAAVTITQDGQVTVQDLGSKNGTVLAVLAQPAAPVDESVVASNLKAISGADRGQFSHVLDEKGQIVERDPQQLVLGDRRASLRRDDFGRVFVESISWRILMGIQGGSVNQDVDVTSLGIPANLAEAVRRHNGQPAPAAGLEAGRAAGAPLNGGGWGRPGLISEALVKQLSSLGWEKLASSWERLSPQDWQDLIGRLIAAAPQGALIYLGQPYWHNRQPGQVSLQKAQEFLRGKEADNYELVVAVQGPLLMNLGEMTPQDRQLYEEKFVYPASWLTKEILMRVGLAPYEAQIDMEAAGLEGQFDVRSLGEPGSEIVARAIKLLTAALLYGNFGTNELELEGRVVGSSGRLDSGHNADLLREVLIKLALLNYEALVETINRDARRIIADRYLNPILAIADDLGKGDRYKEAKDEIVRALGPATAGLEGVEVVAGPFNGPAAVIHWFQTKSDSLWNKEDVDPTAVRFEFGADRGGGQWVSLTGSSAFGPMEDLLSEKARSEDAYWIYLRPGMKPMQVNQQEDKISLVPIKEIMVATESPAAGLEGEMTRREFLQTTAGAAAAGATLLPGAVSVAQQPNTQRVAKVRAAIQQDANKIVGRLHDRLDFNVLFGMGPSAWNSHGQEVLGLVAQLREQVPSMNRFLVLVGRRASAYQEYPGVLVAAESPRQAAARLSGYGSAALQYAADDEEMGLLTKALEESKGAITVTRQPAESLALILKHLLSVLAGLDPQLSQAEVDAFYGVDLNALADNLKELARLGV